MALISTLLGTVFTDTMGIVSQLEQGESAAEEITLK